MASQKDLRSVLVVTGSDKIYDFMIELLPKDEFYPVSRASSCGEARRLLVQQVYDILVINTPMPDDFGIDLALDYADSPMCVMLMVKEEIYDQVTYQVIDSGIVTISKPTTKPIVYSSMRLLSALSYKLKRFEKKNRTLEEKMADIRMINHAKWLIIDKKKMTEEEAHHMIEHRAMERRITKREAAREIIDDLED